MNEDLLKYYQDRAGEYELIYSKPERQHDLSLAGNYLQDTFGGKQVVEIACGTGYWTERIAQTASFIAASDVNQEVLLVAENKKNKPGNVQYTKSDMYQLAHVPGFDHLFAGFIVSHIPRPAMGPFIKKLNELAGAGGTVVIMDNRYVEGSNHPIVSHDADENTYQARQLKDGSSHKVLKNFYEASELRALFEGVAENVEYIGLEFFWILIYKVSNRRS